MWNKTFGAAFLATCVGTGASAITITENFDPASGVGSYTVTLDATDPGGLIGFGVSNPSSTAYVGSVGDTFDCDSSGSYFFGTVCYGSQTLTAANWDTEVEDFTGETFAELFGSFASNVDAGETTINWYSAVDGDMQPGDTSSSDFFLFGANQAASVGLALFSGINGLATQMGIAVSGGGTTDPGPNVVPLPASGVLLLGALGGIGLMRRKRA
ncbi:MAG: VPLPA-CTERM sorting domain-containing protein [Paracoccaceae bacterium]|nr:VPLPA-CTERM sorting domain-containing protein [Paracoccaceae bacterium]